MGILFEGGVAQHPFRVGDFVVPIKGYPYISELSSGVPYEVLSVGATAICLQGDRHIAVFKAKYFRLCVAPPALNAADEYEDIIAAQDLME